MLSLKRSPVGAPARAREVIDPDTTHTVTVGVTDPTGASDTATVTIEVVEAVRRRPPTGGFGGVFAGGLPMLGGGEPCGSTPSVIEFEWNVERDIEALDPANATSPSCSRTASPPSRPSS